MRSANTKASLNAGAANMPSAPASVPYDFMQMSPPVTVGGTEQHNSHNFKNIRILPTKREAQAEAAFKQRTKGKKKKTSTLMTQTH